MKNALIILSTIFLSSCVSISKGGFHPPFDGYQPNKFQYVAPIVGIATESYFLGIGGDPKGDGLYSKALSDLKNSHRLTQNQTLINITYDEKTSWFIIPLWIERKVIVTADIIEFYRDGSNQENNTALPKTAKETNDNNLAKQSLKNSFGFDIINFKTTIKKGDQIRIVTRFGAIKADFISHGGDQFSIKKGNSEQLHYYEDVISVKLIPATEE